MTTRIALVFAAALLLVAVSSAVVEAQCAMCVTALEQNGGAWAEGFNRGILFLLGMPYFVFGAIGLSWWLKRRRRMLHGATIAGRPR